MTVSSDKDKWSVKEMLPLFACDADQVQLRRIGYTVHQDAQTRGLIYNYHVVWTDRTNATFLTWKCLTQEILKSGKVELRVPVPCDGPCGGMTDLDYVEFGLCDHNVCRNCYETAASADHDGIHGCCNADCLELARIENRRRGKSVRKTEKRRAKRLRSEDSFRMQYDNSDLQKFVDDLQRVGGSRSTASESDGAMDYENERPSFSGHS